MTSKLPVLLLLSESLTVRSHVSVAVVLGAMLLSGCVYLNCSRSPNHNEGFFFISNVWSPLFDLMKREAYLLIADTMAALSCEAACQIAGRTGRGITVF